MASNYFGLSDNLKRTIISSSESRLNINSFILEKDIWINLVLEKLFNLDIPMVFKGGTSLSKVYNLINRFSEDVDVTIDYRQFFPETDLSKTYSKNALKKLSEKLKLSLRDFIQDAIATHLKSELAPYSIKAIEISDCGEKMLIHYPAIFGLPLSYMQSNVLIEFGSRNSIEPNERRVTTTLLATISKDLILPEATVTTLSPIKTFWEKVTLIHVECHRGRLQENPNRLSRHWYDLHMLYSSWVGEKALQSLPILRDVILHKKAFFNASYAYYDNCLSGNLVLIPYASGVNTLASDYKKMKEAGMFASQPPTFEEIVSNLKTLQNHVNKIFSYPEKSQQ